MFEEAALRALILSTLAGLSTMIGALVIVLITKKDEKKNTKLVTVSLGFAAGVMISVSLTDLFPISHSSLTGFYGDTLGVILSVIFLIAGMFLAAVIDRFVPHQDYDEKVGESPHKNLFRVGVVSMLAIGLHNFPEGIATFMAGYENTTLGISIAVAIAFHNIPEGIAVAMPIYFGSGSRKKAFGYTFLSGVAEPAGALLAFLALRPIMGEVVLGAVFSVVAGIMIYISVEELIPSSRQYGHDRMALIATLSGIAIMPLTAIIS